MRIWDSEEWTLNTDKFIVEILKAHTYSCRGGGGAIVTLSCSVSLQSLQLFKLMKPFEIPKILQNLKSWGNNKLFIVFVWFLKPWHFGGTSFTPEGSDEITDLPVHTEKKLIHHWFPYRPETFHVLHSQGWQCDRKVRVVLLTVSEPRPSLVQTGIHRLKYLYVLKA